jgi:hypothetical protein
MTTRLRGGYAIAVAASLLALCSPQSAVSQPGELITARSAKLAPEDCNKHCQEKTKRLEHQVRSLQREVVQLRAEVDRLRNLAPNVEEVEPEEPEAPRSSCDLPYAVDEHGIKRYRAECIDQAVMANKAECLDPYMKRPDGVITIKPECLH